MPETIPSVLFLHTRQQALERRVQLLTAITTVVAGLVAVSHAFILRKHLKKNKSRRLPSRAEATLDDIFEEH